MSKTARELVEAAKQQIKEIDVQQAKSYIEQGALLLDVREPPEFELGHIGNAHHIPRGLLEFAIEQHPHFQDKTQKIVVYCLSGGRSALATSVLQDMGYASVYSLQGGYQGWLDTHK